MTELHQVSSAIEDATLARYESLASRALAFVREQGGVVAEETLIAHIFGTFGSAKLWRPLLHQILGPDEEIVYRADGVWASRVESTSPASKLLHEFVALDVETTGLRALHQRIIEIAAIRYRDGAPVERFESLVNPQKRIPSTIVKLTGITDGHVTDAPLFEEIAQKLLDFVRQNLIVGHNVGFDFAFVNAELQRAGRSPLTNERLDTLGLAVRLVPNVRRPNLDKIATQLGVPTRKIHRAGVDAEITAQVALKLAAQASLQGWTSLDQLRATANASRPTKALRAGRGRETLDRALLAGIPKLPGVYLFRDRFGSVVYVGKAKNLRDRVGSYFSQPLGYTRKMDGLVENLAKIDVEVTGSELDALLLEAQLIRRYQPRYNTALRSFEHYPYIRVDLSNTWPRVTLVRDRKEDGARYFGPFRHKSGARRTVELINAVLPLRTCTRSFKDARSYGKPCLQLDLGRCLGPCVGRANRDEYLGLVREVVHFLDGDDQVLFDRLWAGLETAASELDYERARRLRDDLRTVTTIVQANLRLEADAVSQHLVLVLPSPEPDQREVLLIIGGRVWSRCRSRLRDVAGLTAMLTRSWQRYQASPPPPIQHDSIDDINILGRWLYANADHPSIVPLVIDRDIDWSSVAHRALTLSDDDLQTRAVPTDEEVIEQIASD